MTELKVEPKPVHKRAPNAELDGRRKEELLKRLHKLVERYAQHTTPNQAAQAHPASVEQVYTELDTEWRELARKVNNGPEPIQVDPEAFADLVKRVNAQREAEAMARKPLREVPLYRFGFVKLADAADHTIWLSSLCALRVWKADGTPAELYLAPPNPMLEGWADGLLHRMNSGQMYPTAVGQLNMAILGSLGELLGQGRPGQVTPRVVELANDRPGLLNKLWNLKKW